MSCSGAHGESVFTIPTSGNAPRNTTHEQHVLTRLKRRHIVSSKRLNGKVAIVTGAARGVGRGIVLRLAQEGAKVVAADLSSCEETINEVRRAVSDCEVSAAEVNVVDSESVNALVDSVARKHGALDIIVNNAAVVQTMMLVADTPDSEFDRIYNVNFRGVFNGSRAAARVMREQKSGSIINIGSWYAKQGFANFAVYCATKAAVMRMTEALALEMAPFGVRANTVCPGNTETEMLKKAMREEAVLRGISFEAQVQHVKDSIPLGRLGRPEDIAAAIVYLSSEEGAYITGEALNVNGGVIFS
ncbi:SDR family NAD(P)-dependent oxidoreductase [Paraburkholderia sp. DHOC27]|uniref:SDR family NAD(P)-dependent oxidoreductase n=1 Tax=Paraburkholderia sp. DHOC27 TaxID=2303330 RepID=UPI000E3E913D|nr:glucose 1-dehydrogenase [Paraburkholderia sp. DHOC27]RFU49112.1 SDR family oxidoreductase [Paraburkholderia sp. DHOC27]